MAGDCCGVLPLLEMINSDENTEKMFVGKNIHLSPIDGKPLCSFSRKICRQRRLHGYAFCIRHILEDKNAPFKHCHYTTKSGETCINPVPIAADRLYCNNHMHSMGLLPKPIKKVIEKKTPAPRTAPMKTKKKSQDNTSSKISAKTVLLKRSKNLNTRKPRSENTWSTDFAKATDHANTRLQIWQQNPKRKCIQDLLEIYSKDKQDGVENSTSYSVTSPNKEDQVTKSFQSDVLSTYERVYHNALEIDGIKTQEAKLVRKIKHQCAQLKQVIRQKQYSGRLSYSVLAKLIECARSDPLETANALNTTEKIHYTPVEKIFRSQDVKARYDIPCCMMTEKERCALPALPYTRYCSDHISEDSDQLLFVPNQNKKMTSCGVMLRFIHDKVTNDETNKRNGGSSESNSELKRSNKRNNVKKPSHRKKTKIKKSSNAKKTANQNKFRLKCMKQYDIQDFRKDTKKLHAHLNTDKRENSGINTEETQPDTEQTSTGFPAEISSNFSAPTLSESSSDSESAESDILTPEEAFHLPPGSLTFPTGMDDDDALHDMRNNRGYHLADDEEEELIRCESNFILDPAKQSMINRELSSPTGMDDLSEFDQSIGMFLTNTDTPELSPSSPDHQLLATLPTKSVALSLPNLFGSDHTTNGNVEKTSGNTTEKTKITNTFSSSHQPLHFSPPKKYNITSAGNRPRKSSNLGPSTLLKISPIDISSRQQSMSIKSCSSKPLNGQALPSTQQNIPPFTNGVKKPPIINTSISLLSNQTKLSTISELTEPAKTISTQQNGGCWNNGGDSLLYSTSCYGPDVLSDIAMDEETPLEKVNPDIFFTSAFPVGTCQPEM